MSNLGNMLKNNPQQRNIFMLTTGAALVAVMIGAYYASKSNTKTGSSGAQVANVPQIQSVPGTSNSTRYNNMVAEGNVQGAEAALNNNGTFVPVPVNTTSVSTESPIDALDKKIKAEREQKEEEEKKIEQEKELEIQKAQVQTSQAEPIKIPVAPVYVATIEKEYSNNDYMLINTLTGMWKEKRPTTEFSYNKEKVQTNNQATSTNTINQSATSSAGQTKGELIAKAGTIFNAVLKTGINSDEPSPVLAEIVSGPLKGTKLIGKMTTTGEKVLLEFTTASIPNYQTSIRINSVAVDPANRRTALATDVDRHYFLRYGVLLGAAFLGGYADALSNQNSTSTVTADGSVVTTKGKIDSEQITQQALGSVGKELANQTRNQVQGLKPTVYVDSNTAIGLLVMEDLYSGQ